MHSLQYPYRVLYDKVLGYDGRALLPDVVAPWLASASEEKTWLRELAERASPENDIQREESWRLYALSRVVDLLSLAATPGAALEERRWNVAPLGVDEFRMAMEELGLEITLAPSFHPFFHEIVSVAEANDRDALPMISSEVWPGYRIGRLLISRARCHITAGRDHVAKAVAETSALYWAFARNNRRTWDLSVGWGSNSQWRTSFRLDYEVEGAFYFNHEAGRFPTHGEDALEAGEKVELVRHRCFVRCTKDGSDLWPYDWGVIERPNLPLQLTARAS